MIWYQPHTHLWVEVGVNAGWLMRSSGWDECCLLVGKWSASSTWLGLATRNTTTTVIIMVGYCVLHFLFLWRTDFVISSTYQSSMELFMATRGQRRQFLFVKTFKLHLSSLLWPFIWLLNRITRKIPTLFSFSPPPPPPDRTRNARWSSQGREQRMSMMTVVVVVQRETVRTKPIQFSHANFPIPSRVTE